MFLVSLCLPCSRRVFWKTVMPALWDGSVNNWGLRSHSKALATAAWGPSRNLVLVTGPWLWMLMGESGLVLKPAGAGARSGSLLSAWGLPRACSISPCRWNTSDAVMGQVDSGVCWINEQLKTSKLHVPEVSFHLCHVLEILKSYNFMCLSFPPKPETSFTCLQRQSWTSKTTRKTAKTILGLFHMHLEVFWELSDPGHKFMVDGIQIWIGKFY